MNDIVIGGKKISRDGPPFIVAEVGINHNGDLATALKMIGVAKKAGADAVKFQTFRASEFVGDPEQMFTYRSQGKEVTESMLEMFKRYELRGDDWKAIKRKCHEEEVAFLSTPQNRSDLDLLLEIGMDAIKVGSDDFTNIPLLRSYCETGLPMIVSSGMADLAEVYRALSAIGTFDGYPTVLLHCTSQYPTPLPEVRILNIRTLLKTFPMIVVGFSDHTQGPLASSLAVALGARVFEKHFTLRHDLAGPDHWFSEDPEGLKAWMDGIRISYTMLGDGIVRPTAAEENMRGVARRSVVALREIREGEVLDASNIGLRRPGSGLPPELFSRILGMRASRVLAKGQTLTLGDFTK
ncbi:MAG: N-acetylneuraminate synthase family protein [Bacteroidota bacterium]